MPICFVIFILITEIYELQFFQIVTNTSMSNLFLRHSNSYVVELQCAFNLCFLKTHKAYHIFK